MNHRFHRPLAAALALALAGAAGAAPDDRAMAPADREQQRLYWEGHEQLKAGHWDEAAARFGTLAENLRRDEPASADAALYWRAYALAKARRVGEARAALERLRREYPDSRWLAEVGRLQDELGTPASAAPPAAAVAAADDGTLVDAAIEGLLAAPPERALPLLKRVLDGHYPPRSKKRALFVLSQIDDPQATALVLQATRGGDAELRREAITLLGIGGDAASLQALQALYRDSDDPADRRAVLDAYMAAGYRPGLLEAARSGSDAGLRREAVQRLGASGAGSELRGLLDGERDPAQQASIVEALAIAGEVDALAALGRDPQRAPELRRKALQSLGIAGASAALGALYGELDEPALKDAALEGLVIAGAGDVLRTLYREAGSDDDKRRILRTLSLLGDDAALDAIEAAIDAGETP